MYFLNAVLWIKYITITIAVPRISVTVPGASAEQLRKDKYSLPIFMGPKKYPSSADANHTNDD